MKKLLLLFSFFISSCVSVNAPAGAGFFYTEQKELTYFDPYIKPKQKTTMCAKNFFGLVAKGDQGLDTFHLTSSIRKISSIEKSYSSRLGIVGEACTIIKGE